MNAFLTLIGLSIALGTLAVIVWSVFFPNKRMWPPRSYTAITPVLVWVPTFTLFGILVALGILNWGQLGLPSWLRYWIGIPVILIANLAVWSEVIGFGIRQTGGAKGTLKTDGLYRFSRNPQYVADSMMVIGWLLISASLTVVLVGSAAITVLLAAPFSEEIWLRETYGEDFDKYASSVRRYF